MIELSELTAQARRATEELLEAAHLETGDIFVVGCSSSEIRGGRIGHDSSMEVAAAVLAGVLPPLQEQGVFLAAAGMDIGGTLIGMHLRRVAVPVRLSMDHIGEAILLCARTRPPFIGGSRAVYSDTEVR